MERGSRFEKRHRFEPKDPPDVIKRKYLLNLEIALRTRLDKDGNRLTEEQIKNRAEEARRLNYELIQANVDTGFDISYFKRYLPRED